MYMYYRFQIAYGREPFDADDMFDGLRNISADNAIEEYLYKVK